MVSITITGLERVQEINNILIDKKNYVAFLDWLANYMLDLAKLYAPRRTGVLESAGVITGEDMSRTISFNSVPYATYMENGTNYFPVDGNEKAPMARTSTSGKPCFHPFLRTAGYVAVNEIPRILDETIFNKIKK